MEIVHIELLFKEERERLPPQKLITLIKCLLFFNRFSEYKHDSKENKREGMTCRCEPCYMWEGPKTCMFSNYRQISHFFCFSLMSWCNNQWKNVRNWYLNNKWKKASWHCFSDFFALKLSLSNYMKHETWKSSRDNHLNPWILSLCKSFCGSVCVLIDVSNAPPPSSKHDPLYPPLLCPLLPISPFPPSFAAHHKTNGYKY